MTMKRLLPAVSILALFGGGCFTPTPVLPAKIERAVITSQTYKEEASVSGVERCRYSFTMPLVTSGLNAEAMANANLAIRTAFNATSTSAKEDAKVFLDECRDDFENMTEEELSGYPDDVAYKSNTSYSMAEVIGENPIVVNFVIVTDTYMGGAHGNTEVSGLNLDLRTGNKIVLGDLVPSSELKVFMQDVYRRLIRESGDELFPKSKETLQIFVDDETPMTEAEREEFSQYDDFNLTGRSMVFFWNAYDVSPYAAGLQTVPIPFSELIGKFKAGTPLERVIPIP